MDGEGDCSIQGVQGEVPVSELPPRVGNGEQSPDSEFLAHIHLSCQAFDPELLCESIRALFNKNANLIADVPADGPYLVFRYAAWKRHINLKIKRNIQLLVKRFHFVD